MIFACGLFDGSASRQVGTAAFSAAASAFRFLESGQGPEDCLLLLLFEPTSNQLLYFLICGGRVGANAFIGGRSMTTCTHQRTLACVNNCYRLSCQNIVSGCRLAGWLGCWLAEWWCCGALQSFCGDSSPSVLWQYRRPEAGGWFSSTAAVLATCLSSS